MICRTFSFEQGLAPPQEDLPRPVWTKLMVNGIEVTNSVEGAGWDQTPCELWVCEQCWSSSCSMLGLAIVARLENWLVCLPPCESDLETLCELWRGESRFFPHVLLFEQPQWQAMREECGALPAFTSFPLLTRTQLLHLWLQQLPVEVHEAPKLRHLEELMPLLLASDPLSEEEAVRNITKLLVWANESPGSPAMGSMTMIDDYDGVLNILHFDGTPSPSWSCLTASGELGIVVDNLLVFEVNGS